MLRIQKRLVDKIFKVAVTKFRFIEQSKQNQQPIKNAEPIIVEKPTQKTVVQEDDAISLKGHEIGDEMVLSYYESLLASKEAVLVMKGSPKLAANSNTETILAILEFYNMKEIAYINTDHSPILTNLVSEHTQSKHFPILFYKGKYVGDYNILCEMHFDGSLGKLMKYEHNNRI